MFEVDSLRRSAPGRKADSESSMRRFLFLPPTLALLVASCSPLWDRANRHALQGDVAGVLAASGETVALTDCHMVGTTRAGYCFFVAEPSRVQAIALSLEMGEPLEIRADLGPSLPAFLQESPCLADYSTSSFDEVLAFLVTGRPAQLRLADGGQFEYMLMVFESASGEACIEASYAYG